MKTLLVLQRVFLYKDIFIPKVKSIKNIRLLMMIMTMMMMRIMMTTWPGRGSSLVLYRQLPAGGLRVKNHVITL